MKLAKKCKWPALLILAGLGFLIGWTLRPSGPICPATFKHIQLGMPKNEVHAIIGPPSNSLGPFYWRLCGNMPSYHLLIENGAPWAKAIRVPNPAKQIPTKFCGCWDGQRYCIVVAFDEDEMVKGSYFFEIERPFERRSPKYVKDILLWLGW